MREGVCAAHGHHAQHPLGPRLHGQSSSEPAHSRDSGALISEQEEPSRMPTPPALPCLLQTGSKRRVQQAGGGCGAGQA